MPLLNLSVCASNENCAMPLLIQGKHKIDEDVSIDFSSKKSAKRQREVISATSAVASIKMTGLSLQ
jgi:hypothetical protein